MGRRNLGEADRLLIVYTKERGKLAIIARGLRKLTSKLAGQAELFTLADWELAPGKKWPVLTAVQTVIAPHRLTPWLPLLYLVSETLDGLVMEDEPDLKIWSSLEEWLKCLTRSGAAGGKLTLAFLLALLKHSGYGHEYHSELETIPAALAYLEEILGKKLKCRVLFGINYGIISRKDHG